MYRENQCPMCGRIIGGYGPKIMGPPYECTYCRDQSGTIFDPHGPVVSRPDIIWRSIY